MQQAALLSLDQAVDVLPRTSEASELFVEQTPVEQRRLLKTVVQKAAWKDGELWTELFEPFEILRRSNQESSRKEKENAGSGRELGILAPRTTGGSHSSESFDRPGVSVKIAQNEVVVSLAYYANSRPPGCLPCAYFREGRFRRVKLGLFLALFCVVFALFSSLNAALSGVDGRVDSRVGSMPSNFKSSK